MALTSHKMPPRHIMTVTESTPMELDKGDVEEAPHSTDIVETLVRQYGYVPPLGRSFSSSNGLPWWKVLHAIGFIENPNKDISDADQAAIISFISCLASQQPPHRDIWDLDDHNRCSLNNLAKLSDVKRLAPDVYLFARPTSTTCRWMLGVKSASVALYVFRILVSNPTHNIFTATKILISRGVPFRTLTNLRNLDSPPSPLSCLSLSTPLYLVNYKFSIGDFDASVVQRQHILNRHRGRAALLMGGILWRIAKLHLSLDDALIGPSIEVLDHRAGYSIADEPRERKLWDDKLTQNDMHIICGTYKMLTGHGMQETTKSWFPPHEIWSAIHTSGQCWMEWTHVNEHWFLAHVDNIRAGNFQPLSAQEWRSKLRMKSKALAITKKIMARNDQLSLDFLEDKLAD